MMKIIGLNKVGLVPGCCLTIAILVLAGLTAQAQAYRPPQTAVRLAMLNKAPEAPQLSPKRLYALGMIETGNDDWAIGSAGEISRYQLRPAVWKTYSKSYDYENPLVALQVARKHWNYLAAYFKETTGRAPDDFDMYVLWNTGYGYYAKKGFSKNRIAPVVQDRAQRFVNLVYRKG